MKKEYVKEINKLLKETDDISLIDLIYQLLIKSRDSSKN